MFKKLFGKGKEVNKNIKIYAPLTGEYVKIEAVSYTHLTLPTNREV